MFKKNEKGFTLIELLIVVAIIGILAAIAIPQFAAYRIRAFNGAASADLKNSRTAQEALFADFQTYGKSEFPVLLGAVTVTPGVGAATPGPIPASTTTVPGLALSGPRNAPDTDGTTPVPVGVGTGLSNGVVFISSTMTTTSVTQFGAPTFIMMSKHTQGTRVFAGETEGTAIFYVENPDWAGLALDDTTGPTTAYALTTAEPTTDPDVTGDTPGGGVPVDKFTAL